jgi:[ribosomal protein S5]-alanine N-acetyltransferase
MAWCEPYARGMSWPSVFPFEAVGDRVRLREVNGDDTAATMRWARDREFFRFLPVDAVESDAEERAFLEGIAAHARQYPRLRYEVGIEERATGELIGLIRLEVTSIDHRSGDLGYGLWPLKQGQGFATEAAGLLLRFAFERLGLHRVSATAHPNNARSHRVLAKLGMKREGLMRDHMFAHGIWRDSILYAVLEDEWKREGERA